MDIFAALLSGTLEDIFAFGVMLIVTLAVVIIIHEWGHYVAARICGVYVESFSFGFGKEIFGIGGGKGKTRFSVCAFPLGGYVKLFGDVDPKNPEIWDHDKNEKRTLSQDELKVAFCTKSVWQRIFIVGAGPLINIFLTFMILVMAFMVHGQRSRPSVINAIAMESAAHKAGVQIGDEILKMDGKKPRRLGDIYDFTWFEDPPMPHTYTIKRDGEIIDITFTAKRIKYENKKGVTMNHGQTGMVRMGAVWFKEGMKTINGIDITDQPDKARQLIIDNLDKTIEIGIPYKGGDQVEVPHPFLMKFSSEFNQHLFDPENERYDRAFLIDPDKKQYFVRLGISEAISRTAFLMKEGIVNSYKVIEASFKGKNDDRIVSGVGTVGKKIGDAVKAGPYDYIMILATFSFMIGFINLLPIPVLDGGYLIFLSYEAVFGKPVPPKLQNISMIIGLFMLIGLMIYANIGDLISLFFDTSQ